MGKPAQKTLPGETPPQTPHVIPAPSSRPEIALDGKPSLARALTPRILLDSTPAEWLFNLSVEKRHLLLLGVFCAAVFLPYLGAVGFWDPWEPHYGEVAREMIQRQDYVHPFWECAYFFSKPVLPLWLMAIGMLISGANDPARGVSITVGSWAQSIVMLLSIALLVIAFLGILRIISRRGALWSAAIVAATPFYFLTGLIIRGANDPTRGLRPGIAHLAPVGVIALAILGVLLTYQGTSRFMSRPAARFLTGVLAAVFLAIGLIVPAIHNSPGGISVSTEWWVRSLVALMALIGVFAVYLGVGRTISRRAAIWSAVILATCPFYFLIARQAMVDMPFVAINTSAIACLMIAVFEKETVQDGWLYAFYALAGIACLAKGLLGIALPGAAMLGYLILSGDWRLLGSLRLITGPIVTMLMFMPWYTVMTLFPGKDDESSSWFQRFIIHDHFQRLGEGVHTTTPNTTFVYFIRELGFGLFPWVAAVPGALSMFFTRPPATDARTRQRRAKLFVMAWAATTFTFFSLSATKFHHYIFPCVPAIAILMGLWIEQVLEEGVAKHAIAWVVGGALFALVARNLFMEPKHLVDLFVYNYERPYPIREVDEAILFALNFWHIHIAITSKDIFLALSLLGPFAALFGAPAVRDWAVQLWNWKPRLPRGGASRVVGGVGLYSASFITFSLLIAHHLCLSERFWGYQPPPWAYGMIFAWPTWKVFVVSLGVAVVATAVLGAVAAIPLSSLWQSKKEFSRQSEDRSDRLYVVGALAVMAFSFAVYLSAVHWTALSFHWTQRDLFWTYYHEAKPSEPIGAYLMNWRGETYYSRNTVRQLKSNEELRDFAAVPGREWVLVEHYRLQIMRSALGPQYRVREIASNYTDKFTLAVIEDNPAYGDTSVPKPSVESPPQISPLGRYRLGAMH